jgi:hypothetical protein
MILQHAKYCQFCGERQDTCPHLPSIFGPTEKEAQEIRDAIKRINEVHPKLVSKFEAARATKNK